MAEDLNANGITWSRPSFFRLDDGRKYTPDFFLPEYNVYLDPKCTTRKTESFVIKQNKQLEKIKLFEIQYDTQCLVITDKELLTWDHIKSLLQAIPK